MMKRYMIAAALAVAASGAVGVSASNTDGMKGSDTLFDFTTSIFAACPGVAGAYAGTGSGNGQTAMLSGAQTVAPMSRFLNNGACTGALTPDGGITRTSPTLEQGLVVALDSIDILGSTATFSGTACNADDNTACDPTFEPTTGAAYNTTVGSYTLNGWRDVLRVLLAGFSNTNIGTGAANWAARDCNSAVRIALANSYGNFFENNCTATAGDTTGNCAQIRHIFRRDDFSGTTDTMVTLLGLPSSVNPSSTQPTGANPFCNAVRPAFVFPTPQPTCLQGADATYDPTSKNVGSCTKETAVYRSAMQDNDPIRRTCLGSGAAQPSEDVCSHSGDLGLVLAMNDVQEALPRTNADRYNATPCVRGRATSVTAPDVYDAITQGKIICTRGLLCPNGDVCNNLGGCLAPATSTGTPACLASKLTTPALTVSSQQVPVINPKLPSINDGRSYNAHLYVLVGTAGGYQIGNNETNLPVTGAYYRLHTAHTLSPTAGIPTCQQADMTNQIGCLVAASPCSLGYAGRGALSVNPNTGPIKINKMSPDLICVQGHFLYPLSRKLYLSTVTGFAAVTGQELQLSGCETDLAQPSLGTPAGLVTSAVASAGFIQLPSFVNLGEPFCEDFNEQVMCGTSAPNNDSCANNIPTTFDNFPDFEAVCGDGQVDSYEDCDQGTLNGPPPAVCSTTCRFNN